jgi:hypothetical protein
MGSPFGNTILGGAGTLIRKMIRSPNYVTGVSGWTINKDGSAEFNNVVIRGGQVISGTALYYNGPPAFGNLIASESPTGPTTDSFGNAYLAGFTVYDTVNNFAIGNANGVMTFYTAPNAGGPYTARGTFRGDSTGNILMNPGVNLVTQGHGFSFQTGAAVQKIFIDSTGIFVAGSTFDVATQSLFLADNAAPAAQAGKSVIYSNGGRIRNIRPSTLDLASHLSLADNSAITKTGVTFTDITKAWSVPANDAIANSCYRIKAFGNGTWGSTAQQLNFALELGTGIQILTLGIPSNAFAISTNFNFDVEGEIIVLTTGAGGTVVGKLRVSISSNAVDLTGISPVRTGTGLAFDTTAAKTFAIQADWASTTGAPTLTCRGSTFERIGV